MKSFALALFGAVATAKTMSHLDYDFMRYISNHNKFYETVEEFEMRKDLFEEVDAFIRGVTSKTYRAGHNKFSDWN